MITDINSREVKIHKESIFWRNTLLVETPLSTIVNLITTVNSLSFNNQCKQVINY
ncbi:hypothetical protein [Candidatus Pantoea edessiphila]|uniref:hypothetical protein n=1 Tax=Candidatus Pantoea edessiphila TaxID=2044610 RepID=UPI001319E8F2|nr:hypothetical protein [Candidatus Pantoea edessiphila]